MSDRAGAGFVVPDGGGECEESLQNAGAHPGGFAAAVSFEIELGLQQVRGRPNRQLIWCCPSVLTRRTFSLAQLPKLTFRHSQG